MNLQKLFSGAAILILLSNIALAHDEGHGPKLADSGKYGGIVSPVVDKKDAKLGAKAALIYKAELVRSSDGQVRVYLYDKDMKPLALDKIDVKATALLVAKIKGKFTETPFELTKKENAFVGMAPKAKSKPFNYDINFTEGSRVLLTAFDNLD